MFCQKCGTEVRREARFCKNCGVAIINGSERGGGNLRLTVILPREQPPIREVDSQREQIEALGQGEDSLILPIISPHSDPKTNETKAESEFDIVSLSPNAPPNALPNAMDDLSLLKKRSRAVAQNTEKVSAPKTGPVRRQSDANLLLTRPPDAGSNPQHKKFTGIVPLLLLAVILLFVFYYFAAR